VGAWVGSGEWGVWAMGERLGAGALREGSAGAVAAKGAGGAGLGPIETRSGAVIFTGGAGAARRVEDVV
jgi:hypothetical protein